MVRVRLRVKVRLWLRLSTDVLGEGECEDLV